MKKDLVSVIVPVYNVEPYLKDCLDSIIAQSYSDIEIILVDDGSKDGSAKICDEYAVKDSRIRVLHKANGGVSKARNAGLDMAQGEFVTFIDGDDTVDENYINLMHSEMVSQDYAVVRLSWERGGVDYTYHVKFDQDGKCVVDTDTIDNLHLCANIWGLFRADSRIRFNENLKNGEDSLFVIENFFKSKQKKMLLMNKPYYHYTIVVKSASELSASDRVVAHQKFLDQVGLLRDICPRMDFLMKKHSYSDYFSLMCCMIDRGVKSENGFHLADVQKKVDSLRRDGAKEVDIRADVKYFLYRYRLISLFKILKFIQLKLVKKS